MGYRNLRQCVDDLLSTGGLIALEEQVDAHLEVAEIHRRVCASGGPAVLYANIKACDFPMVSNLFGDLERARYLFRDTLENVRRLVELKLDPSAMLRRPARYWKSPSAALTMRPKRLSGGPVLKHETSVDRLPQLISWPDDGGAFITLPMVYTENPDSPGLNGSNLGMYRVQISGGQYEPNRQVGLHYQIHRGIGVHHAAAIRNGEPLRVNIFVGGAPAMSLAAVMPLPEGMSELTFAGALAGRRIGMICRQGELPVYAEADFCISGTVEPNTTLPEGPFGDHLGYYSLAHDFPVLKVQRVSHRRDAIWPFTVVGRPPQEDSAFGQLIHELTGPIIPTLIAGLHAINAVDAAGVHPLMLAVGSERYAPYTDSQEPQELLTQAHAILGQGQMSLAKYLWIVDRADDPELNIQEIGAFFQHVLRRVDWRRDLHFQTCTTMDTLDYSGGELNRGSKLVVAARGHPRRELPSEVGGDLRLPEGFSDSRVCLPGVLAVKGPKPPALEAERSRSVAAFCQSISSDEAINDFPLIVVVDDAEFTARSLNNFLWVTFTRSNPAADIDGIGSFIEQKHWGCRGALVIDARVKPSHAPPLVEDVQVTKKIDALAARGGPLAKYL